MDLFEVLFLLLLATLIASLITAGITAIRGRRQRAMRILLRCAVGFGIYMAVNVAVSLASPQKIFAPGQKQCFDDWCIAVPGKTKVRDGANDVYDVAIEISSRARRVTQRENGVRVYLLDDSGRRYEPVSTAGEPLDALLAPGEAKTSRVMFRVPVSAENVNLVVRHDGFPIWWFIIRDSNALYHKPTLMQIGLRQAPVDR